VRVERHLRHAGLGDDRVDADRPEPVAQEQAVGGLEDPFPRLRLSRLGERIQRAFPAARVVKALNTMSAPLMVDPRQLADGDHTVFVCSDDPEAKALVTGLLIDGFGWQDVIDLGDLSAARATEMLLPVWLRLWGALQVPMFNFKVVR
jgi:predicted dinucleotide-binding enzyme